VTRSSAEEPTVPTRRTNIELDEALVAEAMQLYGTATMRETVDLALRQLVGGHLSREEALALEGSGWDADLEELRDGWSPGRIPPEPAPATAESPDEGAGLSR
jgi:Arc/MetJ family transcription regulator